MRYLSVAEIAKKWNMSERSVRNYCAKGRVNGAFLTGHPMADLIHASDTLLFGDLENLQNDVVAADINGSKCGILHICFSSFFFKGYPKKPAPNTKRTF